MRSCNRSKEDIRARLLPDNFHPHWFWTRNSLVFQPPILEPLQIISRGAPARALRLLQNVYPLASRLQNVQRNGGVAFAISLAMTDGVLFVLSKLVRTDKKRDLIPRSYVYSNRL